MVQPPLCKSPPHPSKTRKVPSPLFKIIYSISNHVWILTLSNYCISPSHNLSLSHFEQMNEQTYKQIDRYISYLSPSPLGDELVLLHNFNKTTSVKRSNLAFLARISKIIYSILNHIWILTLSNYYLLPSITYLSFTMSG